MNAREPHARVTLAVAALLALGALVACSTGSGTTTGEEGSGNGEAGVYACPGLGASTFSCPKTTLTYANDVAPILARHCIGCHEPGGEVAGTRLDSYGGIASNAITAGNVAVNCTMPPPPFPPLSFDEMTTLECWINTGRHK